MLSPAASEGVNLFDARVLQYVAEHAGRPVLILAPPR